jgi:hypothetical protein
MAAAVTGIGLLETCTFGRMQGAGLQVRFGLGWLSCARRLGVSAMVNVRIKKKQETFGEFVMANASCDKQRFGARREEREVD